jgi:hypothetical protein
MSLILLGLMMTLSMIEGSAKQMSGQLKYQGQASNAATAGSVDALSWFQKQSTQPVSTFAPVRNMAATPPINDTEIASIGIVRTYPLSNLGNVWGRYEVRTSTVQDVTTSRGKTGTGTIWQFDSKGLVFIDKDGDGQMDYTDSNGNGLFDWGEPGEVVAMKTIRSEAQRLSLVLPGGNAGLQASNCATVSLLTGAAKNRVLGSSSGIGIACKNATGTPSTTGATVTGNPAIQSSVNPYNDTIQNVFGVNQTELIQLASLQVPNVASLPATLPAMSLIVITGDATFTTAQPLVGSGILVVLGNLTIPASSESTFNGVIYVTGNYAQSGPSLILGAVVCQGTMSLIGGSDITEVDWDATMVQMVRNSLGGYRFTRAQYLVP